MDWLNFLGVFLSLYLSLSLSLEPCPSGNKPGRCWWGNVSSLGIQSRLHRMKYSEDNQSQINPYEGWSKVQSLLNCIPERI
jgi:hypothetical protein